MLFSVIFAIDSSHAGMVLHMSCVHWDVSRDQFGVMGILMNDGHRCGSHENWVTNGCGHVKFTTPVARVSLICHNARPPVM